MTAEYTHDGHEYLIVATVAAGAESAAATDLPELIQAIPAGRTVLVDLYVTSQTAEEDGSGAPDARADRIRGKLGPIPPAVPGAAGGRLVSAPSTASRSPCAGRTERGVAGRTGSPSVAGRTGRPWRTGPIAAGTRW